MTAPTPPAAFDPVQEDESYLRPVRTRLAAGFKVVVFGHTHLPKAAPMGSGALYLNTGTWADLMRLPKAVRGGDRTALATFANDIATNHLDGYRRRVPTFADVTLEGDTVRAAGVFFFDGPGRVAALDAAGLRTRLA